VRINTAASGKPTARTLLPDLAALDLVLLEAPALPFMAASSPLAGLPPTLSIHCNVGLYIRGIGQRFRLEDF
jgi:hypothetical protein